MAKKKIKICFFSLQAYPLFNPKIKSNFGGAELQSYLLAKTLAKDKNFEVGFIVNNLNKKNRETKEGVRLYKINNGLKKGGLKKRLIFLKKLFTLLKKIDADIYVQRALGTTTGALALFAKTHHKKFIFMTAHENDLNAKKICRTLAGRFSCFGVKNAGLILTQNKEHQKLLLKNYGKKSLVFKNVLELPKKIQKNKKKTILWVASSQPFKQPGVFLQLTQSFPKEKFVMVMPKHPHHRDLYKEIKNKAQKISNLHIIGQVPFSKINNYFKEAKIFVNTSKNEGFPNTFVQAASNATPIISLSVNSDNFLQKYDCGFFAEDNFLKLKKDLKKLLEDKRLWQKMSQNAYNYAKKTHDLKHNIKKLKKYLLSL